MTVLQGIETAIRSLTIVTLGRRANNFSLLCRRNHDRKATSTPRSLCFCVSGCNWRPTWENCLVCLAIFAYWYVPLSAVSWWTTYHCWKFPIWIWSRTVTDSFLYHVLDTKSQNQQSTSRAEPFRLLLAQRNPGPVPRGNEFYGTDY